MKKFVAIENRNPSFVFKFEADCINSMDMVSSRNAMKTTDYIRPLSRQGASVNVLLGKSY